MKLEETIDFALTEFDPRNIKKLSKSVVNFPLVSKDPDTTLVQTPPRLPPQPNTLLPSLTGREEEVLKLIATGLTTNQMAVELNLSPLTVNAHLRSIYSKLGITSRSAATRIALENNLI
jgi:DNA-binding CsgD family transcriptional regulator